MKNFQGSLTILLALLALAYGNQILAQQPTASLPKWLGNHTEVLPPVDEQTKLEVRQLVQRMKESNTDDGHNIKQDYFKASLRFIELGELAGQAMVWLYLDEPLTLDPATVEPRENAFIVYKNGQSKDRLLSELNDDPTLVQWLLPLLRLRMQWFEKAIIDGHINEVISTSEVEGIMGYLYAHGEPSDLEAIYHVVDGLRQANYDPDVFKHHPTLASQAPDIAKAHSSWQIRAEPMYERRRFILKSLGIEAQAPAMKEQVNQKANGAPSSTNQITTLTHPASTSPKAQVAMKPPHRDWIVWLFVVIAAALGAVWVMMRKLK